MSKKSIAAGNPYSKNHSLIISAVTTSTAVEGVSIASTTGRKTTAKRAAKRK